MGGMRRFGSSDLGCGNGMVSVENRCVTRVAWNEIVDAFRLARIKLNEFRGSEAGLSDGERTSSSGGVTIIVIGTRGDLLKMMEEISFRCFKERGSWKYRSGAYWTTAGLYLVTTGGISGGSLVRTGIIDRTGARFLYRVASGVATEATGVLLFSSSSLLTTLGIGGGFRDGAESFHENSTTDSNWSEV
jgi:hypothetical protein